MVHNFPFNTPFQLGQTVVTLTNIGIVSKNPTWKINAHQHDHFELHYIENGLGTNISNSNQFQLNQGTLYLAKPREAHEQYSDSRDPMQLFYVGFEIDTEKQDPWGLEHVSQLLNTQSNLIMKNCYQFEPIFSRMIHEAFERKPDYKLMIHTLFSQLLLELFRTIREKTLCSPTFSSLEPSDVIRIQQSIDFMKEHIRHSYSLDHLAQISCMSTSHFRRVFREVTGTSPGKYFRELKINYAKLLLSSCTVQEAADFLGFENIEHFSKTFKKIVGVSPSHYRCLIH